MFFLLALSASTSVLADSAAAAEEMCQAAIMAMGKGSGYAYGFCRGTSYSAARWACAIKYTSSGKDVGYAIGSCSGK